MEVSQPEFFVIRTSHADAVIACGGAAALVWLAIRAAVGGRGRWWIRGGVDEIADRAGVSRATVFRALSSLEAAGVLVRVHRYRDDGGQRETQYQIPDRVLGGAVDNLTDDTGGGRADDTGGGRSDDTPSIRRIEIKEDPPLAPPHGGEPDRLSEEMRSAMRQAIRTAAIPERVRVAALDRLGGLPLDLVDPDRDPRLDRLSGGWAFRIWDRFNLDYGFTPSYWADDPGEDPTYLDRLSPIGREGWRAVVARENSRNGRVARVRADLPAWVRATLPGGRERQMRALMEVLLPVVDRFDG